MKKKAFLRAAALLSASVMLTVQAAAETAKFPLSVLKTADELKALRAEMISEYESYAHKKCTYRTDKPSKYTFLFIEARNVVTVNGNAAKTTQEDDEIFARTAEEFEQVLEYLTDFNVDVVIDKLIIDDPVQATGRCMQFKDIQPFIQQNFPYGSFDSFCTFTSEHKDFGNPNMQLVCRDGQNSYGGAWVPLSVIDHVGYDSTAKTREEHLYTVDLALHEWIHELQSFRKINSIIMPSADIAGKLTTDLYLDEKDNKFKNGKYEWDNVWPEDKVNHKSTLFYQGKIEPDSVCYAHALLTGCLYDVANERYVGMYPSFWKCFDSKCFFGEFYATDAAGKYLSFPGEDTRTWGTTDQPVYLDKGFVFNFFYSLENDKIMVCSKKFPNWIYTYETTDLKNCTFTKIGFDVTDDYYMLNQATGKYLAFNAADKTFAFSDFKNDNTICWTITYLGDDFVQISPKANPALRFDVQNAWDTENNSVIIYSKTGIDRAQQYQLRQNSDESYSIYPQLSYKRCVTNQDGKMVLATDTKMPAQKWLIEKANGKPVSYTPPVTTTAPVTTAKPTVTTTKAPAVTTTAPVTTAKPTVTTTKAPAVTTKAPVTTAKPTVTTTKAPAATTKAPVTTAKPAVTTTKAPAATTKAPVTTAKPAVTTTKAPAATTKAPVTTAKPTVTTTKAPAATTKAPVTTAKPTVTTTKSPATTAKGPVTTTEPVQSAKKGDVNLDGSIDVADAVLTARIVAEDRSAVIGQQGIRNADVNGSGSPDILDVVQILRYIARIITAFEN